MTYHRPVLLAEIRALAGEATRVVDGTAGGGGHTMMFVDSGATVLAIDRDPAALAVAQRRLAGAPVTWVQGRFGDPDVLDTVRAFHPDLALLDLGVSSRQLDDDTRGFTFRPGSRLDMRMDGTGETAADLLNDRPADVLASIFHAFGDERRSRRLAAAVVRRRERTPFATSDDLVNAIREALGPRSGPPDFARLFQAVRIAVNDELGQLERALPAYRDALSSGGRLLVISYHSGEDRIVKHAFRDWARTCVCPPRQPVCTCRGRALGRRAPARAISPTAEEIDVNPRARSAKLRGFVTDA
jgi:16S rRNA (cytosine1402-N4)-methyltransferase